MHEELIDIYDENMKKIGYAPKKEAHKQGLWHKSIHCWLFTKVNGKPCVIMQRRADCKLLMPGFFDVSVAGHYEKDELQTDGLREVSEEFGIFVPCDSWHYLGIKFDVGASKNAINKEFCEVFFAEISTPLTQFVLNPEEVDAVVCIPVEEGLKLFSNACKRIKTPGFSIDSESHQLLEKTFVLETSLFIPRTDSYYAKIFAIADLYFKGYSHLYI